MRLDFGLNSRYKISAFDSQFRRDHRESIFLRNALVPDNKRKSVSSTFLIQTHADESHPVQEDLVDAATVKRLIPSMVQIGSTTPEIVEWFGAVNEQILHFHSITVV